MKIAVAIIHGIGNQDPTYADEFRELVKAKYQKLTKESNLVFESICWQEKIAPLETNLINRLDNLGWKTLREYFIGYGGDAICYQPSFDSSHGFYDLVNKEIDLGLQRLHSKVGPNSPLCIISHSLGTVVASNFIWDVKERSAPSSPEAVSLIDRLSVFYTMGSPLAVWSLRFPEGGTPIKLQNTSLWYNIYSPNDIISSPIKIINQQYSHMSNLFDVRMKVGGILSSWNPASHSGYWNSPSVINHIAVNLSKLNTFYSLWEETNAKS